MKVLTFKAWLEENKDLVDELKANEEDCPECDGTGECECTCGHIHDCTYCEGTGIEGGDVMSHLNLLYENTKKTELAKLRGFTPVVTVEYTDHNPNKEVEQ